MFLFKIIFYPCNEVVFKGSLDHLMEEIAREQLMNVGAREVAREWL